MADISRRKILQAMGAAGVGASITSTATIAGGTETPYCPDCEDAGLSTLAKYEWNESNKEFKFDGGCDVVEFLDWELDADDEPIDVTWSSTIFYEGLNVKYSTSCDSFTRDETSLDDDTKDADYRGSVSKSDLQECKAISYITFCAAPCFQVDFAFGEPIDDLGNDDGGFYKGRKILHLWGNTLTGKVTGTQAVTKTQDGCTIETIGGISADLSSDPPTATVEFEHSGDACVLSMVSYVAPCPTGFTEATGDQQSLFDSATRTVETDGSFTVELPTVDDLSSLCDEFGGYVV